MLLAGSLFAIILICWALYENYKRSRQSLHFELTPNRLLTRHPLLFVTGQRSLFYFAKYWNGLPEYLAEHGYEVFTLPLPWKKTQQRSERLKTNLLNFAVEGRKYHLFFDSSSLPEILDVIALKKQNECIASLTLISTNHQAFERRSLKAPSIPVEEILAPAPPRVPTFWRLHSLVTGLNEKPAALGFCATANLTKVFDSLLDRAHLLAERDLTKNP